MLGFLKKGENKKVRASSSTSEKRRRMRSIRAVRNLVPRLQVALESGITGNYFTSAKSFSKLSRNGAAGLGSERIIDYRSLLGSLQVFEVNGAKIGIPGCTRSLASSTSNSKQTSSSKTRKEVSKVEDPFDAPTSNIPEKPVTFTEGASYSIVILAGLGIAAAAGYAVFKELIFQPKEYKIFGKALERVQNDGQVRVRIGSPITGYGQESRNRAARQRIPNRIWTDEDGNEHVEVNFYIRGPHGAGKVGAEMFKDKEDKKWKFVYLIVEIRTPSPAQLLLESYVPA